MAHRVSPPAARRAEQMVCLTVGSRAPAVGKPGRGEPALGCMLDPVHPPTRTYVRGGSPAGNTRMRRRARLDAQGVRAGLTNSPTGGRTNQWGGGAGTTPRRSNCRWSCSRVPAQLRGQAARHGEAPRSVLGGTACTWHGRGCAQPPPPPDRPCSARGGCARCGCRPPPRTSSRSRRARRSRSQKGSARRPRRRRRACPCPAPAETRRAAGAPRPSAPPPSPPPPARAASPPCPASPLWTLGPPSRRSPASSCVPVWTQKLCSLDVRGESQRFSEAPTEGGRLGGGRGRQPPAAWRGRWS